MVATRVPSLFVAIALVACRVPGPPEGELRCIGDGDCPPSFFCHLDEYCYASPEEEACGPGYPAFDGITYPTIGRVLDLSAPKRAMVDILFVLDITSEMAAARTELEAGALAMIESLSADGADWDGDGESDVDPISVRIGVITSDLGSGGQNALCPGSGDDAVLQIPADGACGTASDSPFLEFDVGDPLVTDDSAALAANLSCLLAMGGKTTTCPYSQPLEAALAALTTQSEDDGANSGFLRNGASLGLYFLTNKNDCSAADPTVFSDAADPPYPGSPEVRCSTSSTPLYDITRYGNQLQSIKPPPSLVLYAHTGPGNEAQELVDPEDPTRLIPSCDAGIVSATPASRIQSVAYILTSSGATSGSASICTADADDSLAAFTELLAAVVPEPTCIPPEIQLIVSTGTIPCSLIATLPEGATCDEYFPDAPPETLEPDGSGRVRCLAGYQRSQLNIEHLPPTGDGWWLDVLSPTAQRCGSDRGAIMFNEPATALPSRDTLEALRLECATPPIAEVGAECAPGGEDCTTDEAELGCDPASSTCQLQCETDADCAHQYACVVTLDGGICRHDICP